MSEVWKDVVGYEGLYQVSDLGKMRRIGGKILKPYPNKDGYLLVGPCKGGKKTTYTLHKLVAITFMGPRPHGQEILHLDDNPANSALSNLRYGSKSCNGAFMVDNGTVPSGCHNKLTWVRVKRIREFLRVGISVLNLAKQFNVSNTMIRRIKNNKAWVV